MRAPYKLSNTVISPIKTKIPAAPSPSYRFTVITLMLLRRVCVCVCRHTFKKKKNVFVHVQVPPCACFILLVMVEIVSMPPLPGPAGCFRVSRMGGGGNISMCGGRTEQTFAVYRLYNPYLLVAGSAAWNRALPTMLMLMPPSRVGMVMLSSQTGPFLIYIISPCVFRDGDTV